MKKNMKKKHEDRLTLIVMRNMTKNMKKNMTRNMARNMTRNMKKNMKGKHEGRLTLIESHDGKTW